MGVKELKRQIRQLRKLKRQLQVGTDERIKLHRQIKELRKRLDELKHIDPEKEKVINEIIKMDTEYRNLFDRVYYNQFTLEQLQKHLANLKMRRLK